MTDIITRLEGAEGADRELAEAVLVALGWEREGDSALRWVRNGIRIREGAAILDPITGPGHHGRSGSPKRALRRASTVHRISHLRSGGTACRARTW